MSNAAFFTNPMAIAISAFLFIRITLFVIKKIRYRKYNFNWYRETFPTRVQGGRVSCYECGGDRIHARALMRNAYTREHFCTACGKTLYYSPEG
jgi:uncharacterized paraquat-inducible protein A